MKFLPTKTRGAQGIWMASYGLACCLILPFYNWYSHSAVKAHDPAQPRRLVLVLDGVPYETIAELKAEGRFRNFREPARMVSTFPSLTNPAMIEILDAEESPGYEDHYYDRERNRLLGSIQDRLRGEKFIQGTFRETFDYHAPAFKGALGYVAAPAGAILLAQFDLAEFRSTFRKSKSPLFVGYIGETDSLAHLGGEGPLKSFLRTLDRTIEEAIAQSNGRLEVELFSDHGNDYSDYKSVKLNDAIKQAGFTTEKTVKDSKSVVLPKHGLVGSSMLFTSPENRPRLAEVSSAVTGVDFTVYPSGDNVIDLISKRGRARLFADGADGKRFKYSDLGGDPLALTGILREMSAKGLIDDNGFASSEDWWTATKHHKYVDPVRRIFDGFNKHVKSRADVIVSYEDGYLVGSPVLNLFARMRATHGNLLRGETEGFVMSTRQSFGDAVRGNELNRPLALDQRSKADGYFSGRGHCEIGPAMARMAAGR